MDMKIYRTCPECEENFYSLFDKRYIELFKNCFDCDERKFERKLIKEEEINKRRKTAIDTAWEEGAKK